MPGVGNPLQISRYQWARPLARWYDKVFFSRAKYSRCILAAADSSAIEGFVKRSKGKVAKDKVLKFPTRYDADIFNPKDRIALRTKYKIDRDCKVFVTTGRLNWFKGWKLMIDAFKLCFKQMDDDNMQLFFVGDGEDRDKIIEYTEDLELKDNVFLLGRKPLTAVSEYLALADEFIMGSFAEGWSTSLVEAVASGLPCVVTDFSSAEDMVKDGFNGFVLKNRSEEEFSKRMMDALRLERVNLDNMCKECQNLSVQKMKEEMLKLITPYFANVSHYEFNSH